MHDREMREGTMLRVRRTRGRTGVGTRSAKSTSSPRRNVRRAKRAAMAVAAVKAGKARATRRRRAATDAMAESRMKPVKAPRKARAGRR